MLVKMMIIVLLGAVLWPGSSSAAVYMPGRLENGIYVRPHFRSSKSVQAQDVMSDLLLEALSERQAPQKLPPVDPPDPALARPAPARR